MVKRKTTGWLQATVAATVVVFGMEARAESLRCGQKLASTGDSLYQVRAVCGEPDAADRRVEVRTVRRRVRAPCFRDRGELRCERMEEHSVEVVIDEWTYDFGKRRFVHQLTFEDGRLMRIATAGYGHKDE